MRLGAVRFLVERGRYVESLSLLLENLRDASNEQFLVFEITQKIFEETPEPALDTASVAGRFLTTLRSALSFGSNGDWKAALGTVEILEKEFPNVRIVEYYRAWIHQMTGDRETAISLYENTLRILPEFYEARMNLGAAYMETGNNDEARTLFRELLTERPDDITALINIANTYARDGDLEESEKLLVRATSLDPENYLAGMNLGIIFEGRSKIDEAISQYQGLIFKKRETPELYTRLAGCFVRKGDTARARESLEIALRLDPEYVPARRAIMSLGQQPKP